jgi:HK97 family phage prohead protease
MNLDMEVRSVSAPRREIEGVAAPYDETTRLVAIAGGERLRHGVFARSIQHRADKVPLFLNHDMSKMLGRSVRWTEELTGLAGTFGVRQGEDGDRLLADVADGWLPALSVGFEPIRFTRAPDGVVEHLEARLVEVSLVTVGAYAGGVVTAVRSAAPAREQLLAPFLNPPTVNLAPIPRRW